jgi:two-component system sensor histidine kinase TctE
MAPDSPAHLARPHGDAPAAGLTAPAPLPRRRSRWYGLTGFMSEGARPNTSLFGEILDWLWVPVMLLMPVSLLLTFAAGKSLSHAPFDRALSDSVQVLAEQVKLRGGRVVADLPLPAREILRADDTDTVYFQVVGQRGEFVSGDRELPLPAEDELPAPGRVMFRSDELHGVEVRIAYTWVDLPPPAPAKTRSTEAPARPALVQVAETLDKRAQLADEIVKGVILPQFIILPFAAVLIWLGLARGLRPLSSLVERIHRRRPGDLSPIPSGEVPTEVEPLISSINDLMRQVDSSLKGEQRFIANAAHQLRTPLAGIKMQTDLALRQATTEPDGPELRHSLEQMAVATRRLARMVNQLLALTRAEKGTQAGVAGPRLVRLDLGHLVRERVREWVPEARARHIDLGVEGVAAPLMIEGNAPLLAELINNLLDNAIRYTPQGGEITVRLLVGAAVVLEVEDNGIGIAPDERELVFERFYRVLGAEPDGESLDGSGLGLAIVREIAYQHRAPVRIRDAAQVRGTVFSVEFPLIEAGPAQDGQASGEVPIRTS